MLIRET